MVDAVDIEIPAGVVSGFVGPNGAGKTTTLRMLLGLVRPSEGTGEVLGAGIARPQDYLGRVGALIEAPAFYPTLSGRRNLEVLARLGGGRRGARRAWTSCSTRWGWASAATTSSARTPSA